MRIAGVLTQRQAVEQVCGIAPLKDECEGTDNSPEQAWAQMRARLTADARTALAGLRMRSTDIKYCYQERCAP